MSCCRLFYSETGLVTCDGLDFYRLTYFPDDLFEERGMQLTGGIVSASAQVLI